MNNSLKPNLYSLNDIHPQFDNFKSNFIAHDAILVGDIYLKENANIWFGAVARGDNERITIGKNSNVQDGCAMHTDMGFPLTIGENCTIGHRAIVHGCVIGDNSLIGMGAIILNGAHIGKNCIVGAGALVPEGKQIPDGSLVVGVPGKIVRPLSEEEIIGITKSAQSYVKNGQRFLNEMKPVC